MSRFRQRAWLPMLFALAVFACEKDEQAPMERAAEDSTPAGAFVQLFEWRWADIATECENFLGSAGYTAVQVSPPNEHVTGPEWWTRYQPVSYKIESRSGTRAEFADMVARCKDAGVGIYADAIINHMAGSAAGSGIGGSEFSEFHYAVPYDADDFHHCDRYDDDIIRNYQDLWEIQNCHLSGLDDLNTGKRSVQNKIAAYLNDLLSLGVAGFRLDASKHIAHGDIAEILHLVDGDPFVFQEVIDRGGEPIDAMKYIENGSVTEFKYPMIIEKAFKTGDLDSLTDFWSQPGWLPFDKAIVFVDNHDIQRGHAGSGDVVNYKDGTRYNLAVAFMLAYPYGYPMVMSSYQFDNGDQGPPASSSHDETLGCDNEWVCEHRRKAIASMVGFRLAVGDAKVVHWKIVGETTLSFGRGNKGHIVINISDQATDVYVKTDLPPGQYRDLISGSTVVSIDANGLIDLSLEPMSVIAIQSDELTAGAVRNE